MPFLDETSDGVVLRLQVRPGAKRSAVRGAIGDALKVEIKAPPVDGKANVEITKFLAELLGVGRGDVEIRAGKSGRKKRVRVVGVSGAACRAKLADYV